MPDNFTAAPHLLRHSPRDVILAIPPFPVSNEAVSVSLESTSVVPLVVLVGLLARLKSYLVLIRIISISLTIYHYGVLCRGGLQ